MTSPPPRDEDSDNGANDDADDDVERGAEPRAAGQADEYGARRVRAATTPTTATTTPTTPRTRSQSQGRPTRPMRRWTVRGADAWRSQQQRDGIVAMVGAELQCWRDCDTTASMTCANKAVSVGETRIRRRGGANRQGGHKQTAARMNARAKDRTNARQDDPAETGGNPKAPPKSGFPVAASIENVLSGDEGEDDFVLEGPAAGAKGARARARNTIATPSRLRRRRPKPMEKRAHAEALPIVSARRSIEGMETCPTREHIQPPGRRPPSAGSAVHGVVCQNP